MLTSVELCAGAGGQALGLEKAGFDHTALVEIDKHCCATLRHNRPQWNVLEEDVRAFKEDADAYRGIDLLAGGLPCPPFSVAGKQLGEKDERNLFDDAIEIVAATRPRAVMIENVRGFLDAVFHDYREKLKKQLAKLGYETDWRLLNASDYGVPQLRPRVAIVALRKEFSGQFNWPDPLPHNPRTVGETLLDLMKERGWRGADDWAAKADEIAPTIVGGSKKHGGPDLGPTRARRAWAALGVEGRTIAYEAPDPFHNDMPRLTVRMVARIQGFPDSWHFTGAKTNAYRQVGNAFPPPVAEAVARQIRQAIARPNLTVVRSPASGR
ncbi:DNA cytosine methyltransferase [Phaeobacter gallaeciensis]|uniref:Cytosine-specific methyltransferase n=1 Tax=Phaeobacter gallaeciensis TaxID=60890 RepID=A0AAD0EDI3_9RHOB|nr:DNA cytosine methyltransferase [Phaeobacter gallaeciensis]AHD10296.1 DNA-methyltransferase (dcm) [Phaeobacter gallaeciensis DSM 26640]ATE93560.1 modification methylase NaeI [Phaeobacter gallaeciensis]ATE96619.1 modification methylase NaeI [Phaeobacter gallaeciensis]ATF02224.1 modification methylase NaeI [Phaeobacter gallaeciensis]ATF06604.1 modification methylase NaeI [Phaeobacter gallaeciensis]